MRSFGYFVLGFCFLGCSGAAPEASRSEAENAHAPGVVAVPGVVDAMSNRIGFARVGLKGFAAFDLESGAPLAEVTLDGAVIDLEWDEIGSRLLVVELSAESEETSVSSWELSAGEWQRTATSPGLGAAMRVVASHGTALVMSEDMGVSWSVVGPKLDPIGMPKLLGRPSGVAPLSGTELVALDPNGGDASGHADLLHRVRLHPLEKLESVAFPAVDRPDTRWALVDHGRRAIVVRKQAAETSFELGSVELGPTLKAPDFSAYDVPGATGSLASVVFDPERNAIIALLSRAGSTGELVFLPLDAGAIGRHVGLDAAVELTPWLSRDLALHEASDTLIVAQTTGLRAFRGTRELTGFDGARYRAPLVIKSIPSTR